MPEPSVHGGEHREIINSKVRLAVVVDAVQPWHVGGAETRYAKLLPLVNEHGVQVTVLTMRWWGSGSTAEAFGLRHEALCALRPMYVGSRRSVWQAIAFAASTLKLVFRTDFDAIEADQAPYLHLLPLKMVAVVRRVPLVVTWHEYWGAPYWIEYAGKPLGVLGAFLEKRIVRLADHVISVSEQTTQRLLAAGLPESEVTTLYAGVNADAIAAVPVAVEPFAVLYAGRLISHKRVDLLIEAIAKLNSQGRACAVGIIGDGPARDELQNLANEMGVSNTVTFLGSLERVEQVWGYMKSASLFVYPSEREGFGLAVSEALLCGTPVVTSLHPDNAARFLVTPGETGSLIEAGNASELVAEIADWIERPKPLGISERFLAQHQQPTSADLAEDYAELVKSLVQLRLGRSATRESRRYGS